MSLQTTLAQVSEVRLLTPSIIKVKLKPKDYISYNAGQYLQIKHHGDCFSYSIANAPLSNTHYELHIRYAQTLDNAQSLLNDIKINATFMIQLPLGDCHIQTVNRNRPIIFIAAGTGFAPINAMIEQLVADKPTQPFELYWHTRFDSDFYCLDQLNHWQKTLAQFDYFAAFTSVLNAKLTIIDALLARHAENLNNYQIVIAGSFSLVYALRDSLIAQGVASDRLFSDAFSFE